MILIKLFLIILKQSAGAVILFGSKIIVKENSIVWKLNLVENDRTLLLQNIDKVHTTEMGIHRITQNLELSVTDIVEWCKVKIADKNCVISRKGKNWYVYIDNFILTVNANSYTIITAHKQKKIW